MPGKSSGLKTAPAGHHKTKEEKRKEAAERAARYNEHGDWKPALRMEEEPPQPKRYHYRGLPCRDMEGNEMLWCVAGEEIGGGAGVLEWCYDEDDAKSVLAEMKMFPAQFKNLSAERWIER